MSGLTQMDAAAATGLHQTTVWRIENAQRRIRPSTLRRMVSALVPAADLEATVERLAAMAGPALVDETPWDERRERRRDRKVRRRPLEVARMMQAIAAVEQARKRRDELARRRAEREHRSEIRNDRSPAPDWYERKLGAAKRRGTP